MSRPGVTTLRRDTPPPKALPTDVGTGFMTGISEFGPETPVRVTSLARFVKEFGQRISTSLLYDAVDAAFQEGQEKIYISRVVASDAVASTATAANDAAAATMRITAKSKGAWGNALSFDIVEGDDDGFIIIIYRSDVEIDRSSELPDVAEAINWSGASDWVDVTDLAAVGNPEPVEGTALTTGADGSPVEASWTTALARFIYDLGPGQLAAPGRTTETAHSNLLAHAEEFNRVALLDGPDSSSKSVLIAHSRALQTLAAARWGGLFAPWGVAPGLIPRTTRSIPPSATVMGLCANNDGNGMSPNEPAAGVNGRSVFLLDVKAKWEDLDREDLNADSVNVLRTKYGRGDVRVYGWRTLIDPEENSNWWQLNNVRLYMAVRANGEVIGERYVFAQIDGRRIKIGQFNGELKGMLLGYYNLGSFFGLTPEEAFRVDTSDDVNPVEDLADGFLRAVLVLKMSPFAEEVVLEINKRHITEEV